jgi:rod shape-determining protein MreC
VVSVAAIFGASRYNQPYDLQAGASRVSERHTRWLLVLLLMAQVLMLTAQVRTGGGQGSYLERGVVFVLGPVASIVASSIEGVRGLGEGFRINRTLKTENRELRAELYELREQKIRNFGLEQDMRRISEALGYVRVAGVPLQAADVVYIDYTSSLQSAILSVESDSVKVDQAVVSSRGLIGRVVLAVGGFAKVQLITDRAASVGAMIERTRRQGMIRGSGKGNLDFDFVPLQADVEGGDIVVSAGIDGVYPRGIPIGVVEEVEPGLDLFHRIKVVPYVDPGLIDQVYILQTESIPDQVKGELPDASP